VDTDKEKSGEMFEAEVHPLEIAIVAENVVNPVLAHHDAGGQAKFPGL
jgi:hypothetical protein